MSGSLGVWAVAVVGLLVRFMVPRVSEALWLTTLFLSRDCPACGSTQQPTGVLRLETETVARSLGHGNLCFATAGYRETHGSP